MKYYSIYPCATPPSMVVTKSGPGGFPLGPGPQSPPRPTTVPGTVERRVVPRTVVGGRRCHHSLTIREEDYEKCGCDRDQDTRWCLRKVCKVFIKYPEH